MRKILTITAALALILAGCAKEAEKIEGAAVDGPQTINASFNQSSVKVAMGDDGSNVDYTWKDGDRLLFANVSDPADTVLYKISSGAGSSSAEFAKSSGSFTSGKTYVCCHPGNGVRLGADGEFTDKNGKSVFKGQNPVHVENYMVFAGYSGTPATYSFDGASVPTSFGFEAPFTVLKVAVANSSAAAVTPNGLKIDGGKGSGYFLGSLRIDESKGVAASGAADYIQTGIWDGEAIEAGASGAYSLICVQNPSRVFSGLKVSIFY